MNIKTIKKFIMVSYQSEDFKRKAGHYAPPQL